jgi:hypothetical protein
MMMHPLRHKRSRERLAITLIASSVRSIMSKSMWVLVPALCVAPPGSAEIFKCMGKNGTDLYQNFPCQFDSLGSLPSSPPSAKTTLPPGDASQAKPKAAPVDVASTGKSANAREPRIGMTPNEVRAMWGEPTDTRWEEPGEGDLYELWSYGDTRSVRFVKDRVSAIQK